jgi:hypothetical protein
MPIKSVQKRKKARHLWRAVFNKILWSAKFAADVSKAVFFGSFVVQFS